MNTIKFLMFAILIAIFTSCATQQKVINNPTTTTFKVYGNCGMCERRIEKSFSTGGLANADWNKETKMLIVTYDASKFTIQQLHEISAKIGHDTEQIKAKDAVYDKLPNCCQYKRVVN